MGWTIAVVLSTDLIGSTERRGRAGRRRQNRCAVPTMLLAQAVETKAGFVQGLGGDVVITFSAPRRGPQRLATPETTGWLNRTGAAALRHPKKGSKR